MLSTAPFFSDIAEAPADVQAFWLSASDGSRLRAAVWSRGERGTVVIFPGRTEYIEKYGRVVSRLDALGLSVAVIDWRGQGLSARSAAHGSLGHVEDFAEYQRDAAALLDCEAVAQLPGPRILLAHSMGGCIGLRTLRERGDFASAAFIAPMWHLQMRAATRELTARVAQVASFIGLGGRRTPGTRDLPAPEEVPFLGNPLTGDPEQFAWCSRQIVAHPELALGGPSIQWTYAALEEMARLSVVPLPAIPVTVFLGSEESVVASGVIRSRVARMPRGELVQCPGARHEILMERSEVQEAVWRRFSALIDAAVGEDARAVSDRPGPTA